MENVIFEKAGKSLPYVMPSGFDASKLMQEAIASEQHKKKPIRLSLWFGSSAAAVAAVALLLVLMKPAFTKAPDPSSDYQAALIQYCNTASDAEMEKRCDMQDADYMANIEHYEAYYN